jgi:hypothetical protein
MVYPLFGLNQAFGILGLRALLSSPGSPRLRNHAAAKLQCASGVGGAAADSNMTLRGGHTPFVIP